MEFDEIQSQQQQPPCKFSRVGDNRSDSTKLGHHHHPQDGEEENGLQLVKRPDYPITFAGGGNESIDMNINGIANISRLRGWQHSSRIIRVSRASGGKDRHSKVWTSKGLRDRRVRLSVTTAIQFYDLQDRLGYDQPSKAVEWLIKAAADAIADLPSLNSSFPPNDASPSHHHQLGDDQKRKEQLEDALDSMEADGDNVEQGNSQGQSQSQNHHQQQHGSLSKSACSSTSETSKGSGLSLSRGDAKGNRVKARERARERTAKEKEKEKESDSSRVNNVHHQNVSPISQNSTFTELLTTGIGNNNHNAGGCGGGSPNAGSSEANLFHRVAAAAAAARQWPLTPMDYLGSGILSGTPIVGRSGFSGQIQLGNSMPQGMTMSMLVPQPATPFSVSIGGGGESNNNSNHHQLEQLQHFPFGSDHLILPVSTAAGGSGADYNLNFTISSSSSLAAGFNRGTLQSNSSSSTSSPQQPLLTHLQRFSATSTSASANSSSPMDGSSNNVPFFIGTAALENHHNPQQHHHYQFPPGLQLLYGDGSRHSDHKGKGKS